MRKINFPKRAKYKRDKNRIYFADDFNDGEQLEFVYHCTKPSAKAIGNAWYKSLENGRPKTPRLINIKELEY